MSASKRQPLRVPRNERTRIASANTLHIEWSVPWLCSLTWRLHPSLQRFVLNATDMVGNNLPDKSQAMGDASPVTACVQALGGLFEMHR